MQVLLATTTIALTLVLVWTRARTMCNPVVVFIGWWGLWTLISSFNPFGLFAVSTFTYALVLLNMVMFVVGAILVFTRVPKKAITGAPDKAYSLVWAQALLFVVLLYYMWRYASLLATVPIYEARMLRFTVGWLLRSGYEAVFFNYIVATGVYFFLVWAISEAVIYRSWRLTHTMAALNGILYGLIGFGRFVYFDVGMFALIAATMTFPYKDWMTQSNNTRVALFKPNRSRILSLLLGGGLVLSSYTTAWRLGVDGFGIGILAALRQFILYFTGPFRALDWYFATFSREIGLTFGRSTFAGVDEIVLTVLYALGSGVGPLNGVIGAHTQSPIMIGTATDGGWFNAFYTSIMNFYMDFGVVGVFVFPFLFGGVVAISWTRFRAQPNQFTLMLVVYLTYVAVASQFRWAFQAPSTWLVTALIIGYPTLRRTRIRV